MRSYTVEQINGYIKSLLEADEQLNDIYVCGEVSNYRPNSSGHLYFSLKDESGTIDCVMFRSYASRMKFRLENGQLLIVHGNVSTYIKTGRYQLYVTSMMQQGVGDLHAQFEQLKAKLEGEGLFDAIHKKELPFMPRCVGVVASPTGAVVRDIIQVGTRRFPGANIKICPAIVQGENAPNSIIAAINQLAKIEEVDVIIVARGGGSFEDLFCFNNEALARCIFSCAIPIVSAVGHETDFTICDFVSDFRAPTPSAAAEIVFKDKEALLENIYELRRSLRLKLTYFLQHKKENLLWLNKRLSIKTLINKSLENSSRVDLLKGKMAEIVKKKADIERIKLEGMAKRLDAISPLKVLSRGYSVTTDMLDRVVSSVEQVSPDDRVKIRVSDGLITCDVKLINKEKLYE